MWLASSVLSPSSANATADAGEVVAPGSETEALGKNVAANGDDSYSSCNNVRPSAMIGLVA